jgi:hypothetical protein
MRGSETRQLRHERDVRCAALLREMRDRRQGHTFLHPSDLAHAHTYVRGTLTHITFLPSACSSLYVYVLPGSRWVPVRTSLLSLAQQCRRRADHQAVRLRQSAVLV